MDFAVPSKSIFTSIREFLTPKGPTIGPPPRTEQYRQITPTPIAMRSPRKQLMEGGTPQAKRVSECVPFSTRFALLVFSIRLKFTDSTVGLEALDKEVTSLKNDAKKADLPSVVAPLKQCRQL
jgi:hypothetical protein